jgi:ribosomal protein S18 acetylase RimI-like enzyme
MDADGFTFRFGEADDIPAIRDYVLDAGAGLFEYMLDRALPGVGARHLVKLAIADPGTTLSYRNALVAEHAERGLAGVALCYPAADYGIPGVVESIVPKARLDPLRPFLTERLPGTLYLNTLAVAPWARGLALGGTLLDFSLEWAGELGYAGLSLHVWEDNESARAMYRNRGFVEAARFTLPASPEFRYEGPVILMQAPVTGPGRREAGPA